jgi:hypothetical protein
VPHQNLAICGCTTRNTHETATCCCTPDGSACNGCNQHTDQICHKLCSAVDCNMLLPAASPCALLAANKLIHPAQELSATLLSDEECNTLPWLISCCYICIRHQAHTGLQKPHARTGAKEVVSTQTCPPKHPMLSKHVPAETSRPSFSAHMPQETSNTPSRITKHTGC